MCANITGDETAVIKQPASPALNLPLVSIIIANYNYAKFLREAVDSALAQTYPHCEYILVDDCSTDNSRVIIDNLVEQWPQIKTIKLAENLGQFGAILEGLRVARGDYVLLLDADDFLFPECVAHHVAVHLSTRRPVGFTCCNSVQIINDRMVLTQQIPFSTSFAQFVLDPYLLSDFTRDQSITGLFSFPHIPVEFVRYIPADFAGAWPWTTTSCMFFRRDALDIICGAPELGELRICADDYVARAIQMLTGSIILNKSLVAYRIHGSNNFVRRAPLENLITFDRKDEPGQISYRIFLNDLLSRFSHYNKYMYRAEQIFEICRRINIEWGKPGTKSLSDLLKKHQKQLEKDLGPKILHYWIRTAAFDELKFRIRQMLRR